MYMVAKLSNIYRHAESEVHIINNENRKKKDINDMCDKNMNVESLVPFDDEKKAAEIRYAAFIAEKNISFETAQDILTLFKEIGKDSKIIKGMTMNRKKCKGIISNVLCPIETNRVVDILQNNKFSIFVDETSDISNQKWMTFLVRYVDPETLDNKSTDITRNKLMCVLVKYVSPNNGQVLTQLLESVSLDAKDCSASKLFESFKNLLIEKEIPITNIVGLACDNASVMTECNNSFAQYLKSEVPLLITLNCICHSSALVASKACKQLPSTCENLIRNIHSYISGSSKRCAILREFEEFFNVESNKLLKLCNTRWLILQKCVARILENWEILKNYFIVAVVEDKLQTAEIILDNLNNNKIKAYFLF
ncbi:hypothetical protein PUN28_016999 [Cardiocondyla obscurior]|uniref:DUF4371 domain-containing protein n=1 Tax=Cardiocondyla obscurior TaxID=286306 RepID=A0AAW2EM69_9HYME